ncbi:MAG: hypothetical protein K5930_07130 [Treponemataceae bacterium]|nr:hypothetical protein [Treponemataceae bacterium]
MNKRPLRKLAGLVVLYILIFFVIIAIQFENETIINETFGPFNIILSETRNEDNIPVLKNDFQITAGDLTFFSDSLSPAKIIIGENEENLTLRLWQKKSDTNFVLFFDHDVYIEFNAPEGLSIPLSLQASLPSDAEKIMIPYKLSTTAEVSTNDESSLLLTGAEKLFRISAARIDDATISLSNEIPYFSLAEYVEETQFTFDTIKDYELATTQSYNETKKRIQKAIIDLFPEKPEEATFSEKAVIAWLAEMALQNNYVQAMSDLEFYAQNSGRTYISTPFFNTLVAANRTLTLNLSALNTEIKNNQNRNSITIFSNENFIEKCVVIPREVLRNLLSTAKNIIENQTDILSAGNATSILTVFNRLKKYGIKEADILDPYIDTLIKLLESCSSLDENNNLVIMNGSKPMEFTDKINTGFALMDAGAWKGDETLQATGRLLIAETIQKAETIPLETIADLYPRFVPENKFYPHIELLHEEKGDVVWAWTIADHMTFEQQEDNSVLITASFLQNEVHHMIVRGIKKFNSIDIYGIPYRTDPRFESYNSSGYVYENDTESLLLKYKQRSQEENIKLYYK